MAKATPKYTVGQEVVATGHREPEALIVTGVGRLYVYAKRAVGWNGRKFSIDSGYEVTEYNSGGSIYTQEEWVDQEARVLAKHELRAMGISSYGGKWAFDKLTSVQLRAIIDIVKRPAHE